MNLFRDRVRTTSSPPSFLRLCGWILLPVMLLAAVGLISLRKDRLLAETEGREKAADLAERLALELVREFGQLPSIPNREALSKPDFRLSDSPATNEWLSLDPRQDPVCVGHPQPSEIRVFWVDANDQLVYPPACPIVPSPPTADQSVPPDIDERLRQALGDNPPDSPESARLMLRQIATEGVELSRAAPRIFRLAVEMESRGQSLRALFYYLALEAEDKGYTSEAGLPLRHLVLARLILLARSSANSDLRPWLQVNVRHDSHSTTTEGSVRAASEWLEQFCSLAVRQPTALSPVMLETAARWERELGSSLATNHQVAAWGAIWNLHEDLRRMHRSWRKARQDRLRPPSDGLWVQVEDRNWLVLGPSTNSSLVLAQSEMQVVSRLQPAIARVQASDRGARFYTPVIEIAGHSLSREPTSARLLGESRYAPASDRHPAVLDSDNGLVPSVRAAVYLTDPAGFYARQYQRSLWFGLLVIVSAIAAVLGLISVYRGQRRQWQLSQMKSNFVSSVSHELRAPIASIRLLAEGLERRRVTTETKQSEYFHLIVQECRRLGGLIENVLDFSRIEQGRKQYEFEPVDPLALVRQTVQLMAPVAQEKPVPIVVTVDEAELTRLNAEVRWDGRAIQQALINLIDNAIKHSPPGATVTVGLRVYPHSDAPRQPCLSLEVADRGEGIPPAEHQRIFERFYRAGPELRRRTQGVGIGLSIVKHIVTAHGGLIKVDSTPGQGSRFILILPG